MKKLKIKIFITLLSLLHTLIIALETDSLQKAIAIKIAPLYNEAVSGSLPKNYAKKGDTSSIVDIKFDTVGVPCFKIEIKKKVIWSPAKFWKYLSEIDTSAFIEGKKSEEDKKRRLRVLRQHRDWHRRIIRAVRYGKICLDMKGNQLIASWGEPFQKTSAFTIGIGNHELWLFKGTREFNHVVILKNRRIIGWSLNQK